MLSRGYDSQQHNRLDLVPPTMSEQAEILSHGMKYEIEIVADGLRRREKMRLEEEEEEEEEEEGGG
jgi:hypothetical protein